MACVSTPGADLVGPHRMQGAICSRGNCRDGFGELDWPNEAILRGYFKKGQLQGKASFRFEGQGYVGYYENGLIRDGAGPLIFSNGNWYLGAFQDGLQQGSGVVYAAAGRLLFRGYWHEGRRTRLFLYYEPESGPGSGGSEHIFSTSEDRLNETNDSCNDDCLEALVNIVFQIMIDALCNAITK